MESLVYLDLSNKQASESLGGTRFSWPEITYGETATIATRLALTSNGSISEVSRTVDVLRATLGRKDARPESGEWGITVDPTGTPIVVNDLAYDISAASLKTALTSATLGLGTITVEFKNGSWLAVFSSEDTTSTVTPVAIDSSDVNSLFPIAFLRHRTYQSNGMWVHEFRLIQAPVAATDVSSRILPPPPTITTDIEGGTANDSPVNEVQVLYLPPTFRGVYRIKRGYKYTGLLDRNSSHEDIQDALNLNCADVDGVFVVTNEVTDKAHIEFTDSMGGTDQAVMEVEIHSAPEGDLTFNLDFDTPELAALLRRDESITLPFEISAEIEDVSNSSISRKRTLYSGELTVTREVRWEELSTAALLNWLRPPNPDRYSGFDYSQVSNGQLHYSETVGDGVGTVFTIDHNLNVEASDVKVRDISTGATLVLGTDYDVVETFSTGATNTLDVTAATAPTSANWRITVVGLEQTSFFDSHTHSISEVLLLQGILTDLGSRVTDLEDRSGGTGLTTTSSTDSGVSLHVQFSDLFSIFPSRVEYPDSGKRLVDIDPKSLGRARGLLPAIHASSVTALPSPVPAASDAYAGVVYENQTAATVLLPGGNGHRSAKVKVGEFATCDGRLWYPVARYGDQAGVVFTSDFATDASEIACADNELADDTIVQLTTTTTLPSPLSLATDYYVVSRTDDTLELSLTSGGSAIILTDDGTGTHTVTKRVETSYYPLGFERNLFEISINENQLRLRKELNIQFALEMAVLKANTNALWTVVIEVGERTSDSTPALTGANLDAVTWRGQPLLEQTVLVTKDSTIHRFGLRINRYLSATSVDTIDAFSVLYGGEDAAVAPKSANFALRGRLIRFDTQDGESDPTGYAAIKGLKLEGDNAESTFEGTAIIQ